MDDLEKAILISFDDSGKVNSQLKSQAIAFCQQIKDNPSICSVCIQKLCFSKLVQVQFWCLQCLYEALRVRYSSMSPDEKSYIRKSLFSMACFEGLDDKNSVRVLDGPTFVKNKLAQVLATLISFEYPLIWPSVFIDFLPNLSRGAVVIDMFCRVLNSLDDELISLDYPRSAEETAVAERTKDAMRQQCIAQIVRAWYDILSMYRNSDPELCISVLDSMSRYISWIDIELIANDTFMGLLFGLILVDDLPDQIRGAAASCVRAVLSKRMVPLLKLKLLQSLQVNRVFCLLAVDNDSELVSKIAALLTGYASEVLYCYKCLNAEDDNGVSSNLLNEVLPFVFYVIQNCEIDMTFGIVQFLSGYVSTMKSLSPSRETQLHVGQILGVIRMQIRFDPTYRENLDKYDKIGKEEEERMMELRRDLLLLFRNVVRVAPDVTQTCLRDSLVTAVASSDDQNVEELEAALSLFNALGESLSNEELRTGNGLLKEFLPTLLSTRFPCHSNRLVALVYLDTITRYLKFVQENTQYIPLVLAALLDERGIHHPNVNVSRKAGYVFMKVVKSLKAKLVPFLDAILQSLQDKITQFTQRHCVSNELSVYEDDSSPIFEGIGLLIGIEDVPMEKQVDYLSSLLTPLCQQVRALLANANVQYPEESPAKFANIEQIINAINALSKGFSEHLATVRHPVIGLMLKQTLDVLLQTLLMFPKIEPLRNKVTSFIHRMVNSLGASVLPYLPKALQQLLPESEMKELVNFVVLIIQLINKFNTAIGDILEEVYPVIAGRIFNILPRDGFPSGPDSNTEEIRERLELQQTVYTFLHAITAHNLSSAFLSPKSRGFLDPMMQLLLHTSCNHKDTVARKMCVQIFIRLIKDWCSNQFGEEKVPGFQHFVIEAFATNCCLYSVLDKSFNLQDKNTLGLLGEIVLAQKVMYENFGNDFLLHFVTKCFPSAHCPEDLAKQYYQKMHQCNDIKALKSFYQSLIERLRRQENGSLVIR